jgi:DNA-binding MarR family transcriptional regulator
MVGRNEKINYHLRWEQFNIFIDHTQRRLSTFDFDARIWLTLWRDADTSCRAHTAVNYLADRVGCSQSTVKRALRRLRNAGLVVLVKRGNQFVGFNEYELFGRMRQGGREA